jgi:ComF family protein
MVLISFCSLWEGYMKNRKISACEYLLRLFFPPRCICCDMLLPLNASEQICGDCKESLPLLNRNEYPNPAGDSIGKIISAFDYEEGIRKAVHNLKFNDRPGNAAVLIDLSFPILERLLLGGQSPCIPSSEYDIIIPIPIHFRRRQQRGYNQSELLAKSLAKRMGVVFYRSVLAKCLNTPPQSTLGRGERLKNLKEAFKVRHLDLIQGKRILLVDDVMTTGSTLEECGRALIEAGAVKVAAFVIAIRRKLQAG